MSWRPLHWRALLPALVGVIVGVASGRAAIARKSPAGDTAATALAARALLASYGERAHELGARVAAFIHADLKSLADVPAVARPLGDALNGLNEAYGALEASRTAHLLALAESAQGAGADALCDILAVEDYQWNEVRPRLNALSVNLVRVFQRNPAASTLPDIQTHQKLGWPELCRVLAVGARRFGSRPADFEPRCSPPL